jgi:hypothetical protein
MLVVSPHLFSRAVFKSCTIRILDLWFLIDDKDLEVSYVNHSLVKHVLDVGSAVRVRICALC